MPAGQRRVALHKARLTTRTVADAPPERKRYILWDETLTGFGVRVSPTGRRSFIVQFRSAAPGGAPPEASATAPRGAPSRRRARCCRAGTEVRCELSLPSQISPDGRITRWQERIMLSSIPLDNAEIEIVAPEGADLDIDVKRKA